LYNKEIDSLRRGDRIAFNSTLAGLGDSSHLHHLHTFGIQKLPGHKDVENHSHSNGRYKIAPDSVITAEKQLTDQVNNDAEAPDEVQAN
jgi:hypothetical protein